MNKIQSRLRLVTAVVAGAAMLLLSGAAMADPPDRVARLSFFSGPVSFSPAGEDDWVLATPNRPLITGDRLWADAGGRAELQAGNVALRLGESTNVNVLNLDDRATQLELTQGSLYVRVWRIDRGDTVEIDTPNLAFTVDSVGRYRIDVDADGNVTTVAVFAGQGEAYGEGAAYRIAAGDRYSFSGTGLRDYEYSDVGAPDDFDRWAAERDRRYETSVSARYVSRDVIGYQDLDQYGTWSVVADYGNVWYPRSVPSGWAPYRTGHWVWIDPWGWTWIDDAPWGFAPYHYGRWAFVTGRWGWIPGPVSVRPVYAPALVAFIGGGDLRLSLSVGGGAAGIAWFPLGPGEVYQPAYRVSREYLTNVNVSNTRVTNVNITNVYNNYTTNTAVTNVTYRNREAPGAVTAVPTTAFVQSQPVARAAVQVPRELITQQPVSPVARVAPTRASLVAAAAAAPAAAGGQHRPPARALQREVVARTKPPAPPPAFAARQAALAANPGRPAEPAAAAPQQPAAPGAAPARNVKLVAPTQAAAPAPKEESRRGRGQLERRAGAPGGPQGASAAQGTPAGPQTAPGAQPGAPATGQGPRGAAPPTAAGQTPPVPRPPEAEQRRQQQEQQRQQAEQQRQEQQRQQAEQQRQQPNPQAEQRRQQEQQRQQAEQQRQQQQQNQQNQQAEQRRQQQEQQRQQVEQQRQQQQSQQAEQRRQQQEQQRQQAEQQRQQQQSQQAEQRRQQQEQQQRQAEQQRQQQQSQQAEQRRQQQEQQQQRQQAEQQRQQQQSQQAEQRRQQEQQRQQAEQQKREARPPEPPRAAPPAPPREPPKAEPKRDEGKDKDQKDKKGSEG